MKTVIDAVNELKGDLNNSARADCSKYLKYSLVTGAWVCSRSSIANHSYDDVCTTYEFLATVAECETNFGECEQSYKDYKGATTESAKLNLIDKELEAMDIDWSKAPDGATHYKFSKDNEGCFYKAFDSEFALMFDNGDSEWSYTGWTTNDVIKNITKPWPVYFMPKPQPTLTYTQAMADNGELPSVGMECQTSTGIITVRYIGKKIVVADDSEGNEFQMLKKGALHALKPLTPPIELIDGRAYQFEYSNKEYVGIYSDIDSNKKADRFFFVDGHVMASYCTNIQPLTVEVK